MSAVLRAEKDDEVVLDVLLGRQHRILVSEDQLLEGGILHADVVRDLAVVEDVPLDRRTGLDGPAAPPEHVAEPECPQVRRQEDQAPDQREGRKEIGLRHSDLRGLSGGSQLGAPDIRPAAQQVGRDAHDDLGR